MEMRQVVSTINSAKMPELVDCFDKPPSHSLLFMQDNKLLRRNQHTAQ